MTPRKFAESYKLPPGCWNVSSSRVRNPPKKFAKEAQVAAESAKPPRDSKRNGVPDLHDIGSGERRSSLKKAFSAAKEKLKSRGAVLFCEFVLFCFDPVFYSSLFCSLFLLLCSIQVIVLSFATNRNYF